MSMDTCQICGNKISGDPVLLTATYFACSASCQRLWEQSGRPNLKVFDASLQQEIRDRKQQIDDAMNAPVDTTTGYKITRWVNQNVKRHRDTYEQWRVDREFRSIQRRQRRRARRR